MMIISRSVNNGKLAIQPQAMTRQLHRPPSILDSIAQHATTTLNAIISAQKSKSLENIRITRQLQTAHTPCGAIAPICIIHPPDLSIHPSILLPANSSLATSRTANPTHTTPPRNPNIRPPPGMATQSPPSATSAGVSCLPAHSKTTATP
jgi:hypothetical protein